MNRKNPPAPKRPAVLIEALEPRIAPAGLLNESKFTSVAVGGSLLLDASGAPGTFQGLTTGNGGGSGSYLLYLSSGKALVYTTDLNGNGRLDPGEITGIALGKDSFGHTPSLILFSDVSGDIVTNLQPGKGALLTDSDNVASNGRDGQLLTDTGIASITIRTITAADLDPTIAGNTVANRLALTSFSIHGNIYAGGDVGAVTIDTSGAGTLAAKFNGSVGEQLYTGSTPTIGGIYTGTAANNQPYHFTQNNSFVPQVEGVIKPYHPAAGVHGGDISNVMAADTGTAFSIGTLATGDGGTGARGGNITNIIFNNSTGGYQLIAGNGGDGAVGSQGGSILGFNDLGSITSEVILHTGDGGTGLNGVGGAGGTATFATTNIAAGVNVFLGRGGDGFTNGGTGSSLNTGTFVTPSSPLPIGGKFYGTWHDIGDVGYTHPDGLDATGTHEVYSPHVIDFNGDGFGDGIYTTTAPDAVIVVFGDGQGSLLDNVGNFNSPPSATVTLKVPGVVNPVVTIGDFNGDGRPDIAVASQGGTSFNGIYVFLDQIGTALDPINNRNYTRSLVGDKPFSAPLQTALPTLTDQGFYQTSGAVFSLATGDYNGDGITDIAYVEDVRAFATLAHFQAVGILLGDGVIDPTTGLQQHNATTGRAVGSGYFYANAALSKAAPLLLDQIFLSRSAPTLQASSLTAGNLPDATTGIPAAPDVVFFSQQGERGFSQLSLVTNAATHVPLAPPAILGIGLGVVDTDRLLDAPNAFHESRADATFQTLTIQDIDGDGVADLVVLTKTPANFLVTFQGQLVGGQPAGFAIRSAPRGVDNSGIFLGNNQVVQTMAVVDANTNPNYVGYFNDLAYITFPAPTPGPTVVEIALVNALGAPDFYNGNPVTGDLGDGNNPVFNRGFDIPTLVKDAGVQSINPFYATVPTFPTMANPLGANLHPAAGYGVLSPDTTTYLYDYLFIYASPGTDPTTVPVEPTFLRYLTANGYAIRAGDGGNAITGNGGNAGTLGGTLTANTVSDFSGAIAITFPSTIEYQGSAFLQGGAGGNGFGAGGIGGDITGVTVRYALGTTVLQSDAELQAGNGGNGNSGDGGRGGNLSLLSINTGSFFRAGDAGSGLHGGQGGSITGNQLGVYDTNNNTVTLITGNGGEGALGGGVGGDISKWDSRFVNFIGAGPLTSMLSYTTGAGGGAAGGTGGSGGSILNSSPDQSQNNLSGPLSLVTGSGGNGLSGGTGGAITNFVNSGTNQSALPTQLTVVSGNGGIGVSGTGGVGGTITNFQANGTGLNFTLDGSLVGIGRIIAGDGGTSYGGVGGIGGSIMNVVATATSTPLIVAAGAGGTGLTTGGDGGSVMNSSINSAALQIGKMLVVGGKGGDALAAQNKDIVLAGDANTNDLAHSILSFGGTSGLAGNGGNISNITQPIGAQTAVDLIAGNGGSTLNASTSTTPGSGVGRGGSVTGITLTGTVGAISRDTSLGAITNPPIKSYTFTDVNGATNASISALVDFLAAASDPNNASYNLSLNFVLDDAAGNVGIVAGAAGTVRGAQPAANGVNGDVTGITASSIMSIVAGSVDRVAPVRIVSGITLTSPDGVLGADKSPNPPYGANGQLDYYNEVGTDVTNLQPGYRLIDGAIFATTIQQTAGSPIRGPRVLSPMA